MNKSFADIFKNLISGTVKTFKQEGYSEEELKGGFDIVTKIAKKLNVSQDIKDTILKVLEDEKEDV